MGRRDCSMGGCAHQTQRQHLDRINFYWFLQRHLEGSAPRTRSLRRGPNYLQGAAGNLGFAHEHVGTRNLCGPSHCGSKLARSRCRPGRLPRQNPRYGRASMEGTSAPSPRRDLPGDAQPCALLQLRPQHAAPASALSLCRARPDLSRPQFLELSGQPQSRP